MSYAKVLKKKNNLYQKFILFTVPGLKLDQIKGYKEVCSSLVKTL